MALLRIEGIVWAGLGEDGCCEEGDQGNNVKGLHGWIDVSSMCCLVFTWSGRQNQPITAISRHLVNLDLCLMVFSRLWRCTPHCTQSKL